MRSLLTLGRLRDLMTTREFIDHLQAHQDLPLLFQLPDGGLFPRHFHITEVGHVRKNFVDCGGTRRSVENCLLQCWVADDVDHRLHAGKLARIFSAAGEGLPHDELPVEIEYEEDVVSQFPVTGVSVSDEALIFHLTLKHTDCLAKELCLPGGCCPTPEGASQGCC